MTLSGVSARPGTTQAADGCNAAVALAPAHPLSGLDFGFGDDACAQRFETTTSAHSGSRIEAIAQQLVASSASRQLVRCLRANAAKRWRSLRFPASSSTTISISSVSNPWGDRLPMRRRRVADVQHLATAKREFELCNRCCGFRLHQCERHRLLLVSAMMWKRINQKAMR